MSEPHRLSSPGRSPRSAPPPLVPVSVRDAQRWTTLCHVAGLALLILPLVGNILGPLIVWRIKRRDIPDVDVHGKESLNFQCTASILMAVSAGLIFVKSVGLVLLPLLALADLVFIILAAVKAGQGRFYQYPWRIRFFK